MLRDVDLFRVGGGLAGRFSSSSSSTSRLTLRKSAKERIASKRCRIRQSRRSAWSLFWRFGLHGFFGPVARAFSRLRRVVAASAGRRLATGIALAPQQHRAKGLVAGRRFEQAQAIQLRPPGRAASGVSMCKGRPREAARESSPRVPFRAAVLRTAAAPPAFAAVERVADRREAREIDDGALTVGMGAAQADHVAAQRIGGRFFRWRRRDSRSAASQR